MNRRLIGFSSFLAPWLAVSVSFSAAFAAEDAIELPRPPAPNAAVIYWQAFAAIPALSNEAKQKLDAATAAIGSPPNEELGAIVRQFDTALRELHRARGVVPCDWQLDSEAGPLLLLPHLQKARDLSRVALLRSRLRFAAGENAGAISDVLDVLKLARDCAASPILISMLIDVAIEKQATESLALYLPQLKPEELERLAADLSRMPPSATLIECIRWESEQFGGWLERRIVAESKRVSDPKNGWAVLQGVLQESDIADLQPPQGNASEKRRLDILRALTTAEVSDSLRQMQNDYDRLAAIAALEPSERRAKWKEFDAGLSESKKSEKREDILRFFSYALLPALASASERADQLHIRRELLAQAIRVQRHGPDSLQPFRGQKVHYQKTKGGFELRFPNGDQEESLLVGQKP